jgi:hypothetical protein
MQQCETENAPGALVRRVSRVTRVGDFSGRSEWV